MLIEAIKLGNLSLVKKLIEQGVDVRALDNYALRCASYRGHTEIVKLLLEHGAPTDDYVLTGVVRRRRAHVEIVKLLLEHGADVGVRNSAPLRWATCCGHTEVVKILREHITKNDKNKG